MNARHTMRALGALFACCGLAPAQDPEPGQRTVQLTVTGVSDRSVYLDHGRDVGLVVGSRVRLYAPGGEVEVVVRSLSHSSSRATLDPGVALPPIGTRGEAVVDVAPARPTTTEPAGRNVPEHPPWTRSEPARSADQPLLVPTYGRRPDERPAALDGRLFAFGQWNQDQGSGRDSDYLLLRTGLRADATNWLGTGERVRLAGELGERRVMLEGAEDREDTTGRLDLASVAFGTEAWAPVGAEVGRFLSPHLPEIGLVDGAEVVLRYEGGIRVGAGGGAYPRPFPARDAGDDLGVHAFFDYVADPERTVAFTVGAQKTWHEGAPDRDLVLLRGEWRPLERVTLLGSAKVDFYTGSDTIKSKDLELTEMLLQARWDAGGGGLSVTGSHFAWPELKRAEYAILSDELVRDGAVDRLSLQGWLRPAAWLSLRARADGFQDQDRDGTTLGADADVRSVLGKGSTLSLSVFRNEGSWSSGPGARIALRDRLGDGQWRVGYRWHRYELDTLVSGPETYTRESVECGLSWPLGDQTDLDLSFERWFGDGEDAFAFGFFLQWRF